ncbi:hypothetical protein PInf_004946 [Phytophthora infestans]|nr:hypothetical protein PInf_004946 [Phytophthora infestans]
MATGKIKVTKHERGKKWRQLLPPILVDAGWLYGQCCTTTLPFDGFSVQLTKAKIGAMSRHRQAILRVPPHLTIKAHRESYLKLAADLLVLEAITPELCYKCSLHTMKFHARAIQMKDMPVGE